MNSTEVGKTGEDAVVQYLSEHGYRILDRNWRTKWCEIDIVAAKEEILYFVEVKYRKSDHHGDGLEYITDKKLQQMSFAAELWVHSEKWNGGYELAAASVSGDQFIVGQFIVI